VPRVAAVRTYLELAEPGELRRAPPAVDARFVRVPDVPADLARRLYVEVGRDYQWRDRLGWTDAQWRERFDDPAVTLHVLDVAGVVAGYVELGKHGDGSVEIAYFGLLPPFHGRGLGRHLLTAAADAAWAMGATRVWLHTCTLDDPAALPNYLARGFRPFREERYEAELPD
jgi:GNAT superfamily N-acetyltransferase